MIKKILFPILAMALLAFVSCEKHDDNTPPTDPETNKGKLVKVITHYTMGGIEYADTTKITYGSTGYASSMNVVYHESKPHLVKRTVNTNFTYDSDKKLVKKEETFNESEESPAPYTITTNYTYNDNGFITNFVVSKGDTNIRTGTCVYNADNLLVETQYNLASSRSFKTVYEYNESGELVTSTGDDRGYINLRTNYYFDDKKNPFFTAFPKEFLLADRHFRLTNFFSKHNLVKAMHSVPDYYEVFEYTYTYNNDGYPIKRVEKHSEDGKELAGTVQEYIYE